MKKCIYTCIYKSETRQTDKKPLMNIKLQTVRSRDPFDNTVKY